MYVHVEVKQKTQEAAPTTPTITKEAPKAKNNNITSTTMPDAIII